MRVLTVGNMYPPHHLGGYELVWRGAVEHLRARGHEVTVLTTDHRRHGVGEPDPADVHRDLRWWWRDHRFPRYGPLRRLRWERHNRAVLAERLEADRPEVVMWWSMGGMSLSLIERVRATGLPAVGVVHDDWLLYGPRVDAGPRLRQGPLDLSGVRWLFVSDFVRRKAVERSGFALERAEVVPSGIDAAHLRPLGPARPWDGRLLCVGRLDRRKGLDTAIAALAHLPEARLNVVGDGDDRLERELREQAAKLGVSERVGFRGRREGAALTAHYDAADAVLFPVTWDEPWGLVPLEAMAHGVPVIATGRGGSGEYLRDGENALLHPAGDAEALAAAVRRLAADAGLRERLRQAGAATAAQHTATRFHERLEAVLGQETA